MLLSSQVGAVCQAGLAATDAPRGGVPDLSGVVADLGAVVSWLPLITDIMGAPDSQVLGLAQITAVLVKRLQAIGTGCAGVLDQRLKSGALNGGAMAGFTGGAALGACQSVCVWGGHVWWL